MFFSQDNKRSRIFKILPMVLLMLMLILFFNGADADAGSNVVNEDITKSIGDLEIFKDTTVNGNVKVNIGSLNVKGTVNGDLTVDMGEVDISGSVTGNIKADMGKVDIDGTVNGNVRADMGEILVSGDVVGNIKSILGRITISGNVSGDVESDLGEVVISGTVSGNVKGEERKILVNGTVDGDINLLYGTVELGPNAVVKGTIYIEEGRTIVAAGANYNDIMIKKELSAEEIDNDSIFPRSFSFRGIDNIPDFLREGEFLRNINFFGHELRDLPSAFRFNIFGINNWRTGQKIVSILIMFALAVLVFTLFPRPVENVRNAYENNMGQVVLWGIIAVILALPLMILLIITIIGIPLIVVEILAFAVAWLLGYTGMVYLVGRRILDTAKSNVENPFLNILVGVAILGIIGLVPVAGGLVSFAIFVLAVGSSLVSGFGTKRKMVEEEPAARSDYPENPEAQQEGE